MATDGLGKTTDTGNIHMGLMKNAMAMSGSTLPQVNSSLSGTWHVVTSGKSQSSLLLSSHHQNSPQSSPVQPNPAQSNIPSPNPDGFGSVKAVLDPTATGEFSKGIQLETTTDVPGNNGNEPKGFSESSNKKASSSIFRRLAERSGVVQKRAHNINADYPMAFAVPAGTTCSGSMMGMENVCLVKIANENNAGPFGGVVAIQMASAASAASASSGGSANVTAKARSFRA